MDDTVQTRTTNTNNEITDIIESSGPNWQTPFYNDAGAMLGMPNGVPGNPSARVAKYDAWGRMVLISSGLSAAGTYAYDGLNRRIIKNTQSGSTILETRHYYYSNQWQVLEECVGSSTDPNRQFVWGIRHIDDLVLRDRDTDGNGTLDERLYAMQDSNWNVIALCNDSAVVQERYTYTPYGIPSYLDASFGSIGSSGFAWTYLFTGRERDNESSLQYNRNRYYHARLGCWLAWDPIGYETTDLNLYRYVENCPLNRTDPSGLFDIAETIASLGMQKLGGCIPIPDFLVIPIPAVPGATFRITANICGDVTLKCCKNKSLYNAWSFSGSLEGYFTWGMAVKADPPGRGRRNERVRDPWNPSKTTKRKNIKNKPAEPGNVGHSDIGSGHPECPDKWVDFYGSGFARGTVGAYVGVQFSISKQFRNMNDVYSLLQNWEAQGSVVYGVWGVTVEIGVGINVEINGYLDPLYKRCC